MPDEAKNEMQKWITRSAIVLLTAMFLGAAPAGALPIEASVGTGPDLATVALEFGDGADFVFEVFFDDSTPSSGLDLMLTLEAELVSLSLVLADFGFGVFVDGISYDGHSDVGFGGGEDYWHYWTKDSEALPWVSSLVGASDRVVLDGAWDGWVYGTAAAPIPEPSTALLVGIGLVGLASYRRAQSSL